MNCSNPSTGVADLGAAAQDLSLFVHKPHRIAGIAYIHPDYQGRLPRSTIKKIMNLVGPDKQV